MEPRQAGDLRGDRCCLSQGSGGSPGEEGWKHARPAAAREQEMGAPGGRTALGRGSFCRVPRTQTCSRGGCLLEPWGGWETRGTGVTTQKLQEGRSEPSRWETCILTACFPPLPGPCGARGLPERCYHLALRGPQFWAPGSHQLLPLGSHSRQGVSQEQ